MPTPITVPRLGWSMDEATFAAWLKQDGQPVKSGEPLFTLESDKATQEVESLDSGILMIPPSAPEPGDTVRVGQLLGYLIADGEAAPSQTAPAVVPLPVPAGSARPTTDSPPAPVHRDAHATPRARRALLAKPAARD